MALLLIYLMVFHCCCMDLLQSTLHWFAQFGFASCQALLGDR
jgi:hypothetical protein